MVWTASASPCVGCQVCEVPHVRDAATEFKDARGAGRIAHGHQRTPEPVPICRIRWIDHREVAEQVGCFSIEIVFVEFSSDCLQSLEVATGRVGSCWGWIGSHGSGGRRQAQGFRARKAHAVYSGAVQSRLRERETF